MISVFSCTNRENNLTFSVADFYYQSLLQEGDEAQFLDFRNLPQNFIFHNDVFNKSEPDFAEIVRMFFETADKYIFVMPEYNGSYPGVLKALADAIKPEIFRGKKALLVGVSTGRAGNLRGMDHFSHVLMHLGVTVMPFQLPVSRVNLLLDEHKKLVDEETHKAVHRQIGRFRQF